MDPDASRSARHDMAKDARDYLLGINTEKKDLSFIFVKDYIPGPSMSTEEFQIHEKMKKNISIINSLNEAKKKRQDSSPESVQLIQDKINEGYRATDKLAEELRTFNEINRYKNENENHLSLLEEVDDSHNSEVTKTFDELSSIKFS